MKRIQARGGSRVVAKASVLGMAALLPAALAVGATTDLATQPLTAGIQPKPNLMVILDDSGSMGWPFMPDALGDTNTGEARTGWVGYWSSHCNGLAFNPAQRYLPPLNADGSPYPDATFGAAREDGFDSESKVVNLSDAFYYVYQGREPAMNWTYTKSGIVSNSFYQECKQAISSTKFRRVELSTASQEEKQNYANWYAYYRKRYLLMRTAMGRALSVLDSNYRVGFSTISDPTVVEGKNHFSDVKDFNGTQKKLVYGSLYTVPPAGSTPLRAALSKAGRYFAKVLNGQSYDPMQYSCQRNVALLTTDGQWNTIIEGGVRDGQHFGAFDLTNSNLVGNQDGEEVPPMKDGSTKAVEDTTVQTGTELRDKITSEGIVWSYTETIITPINQVESPNYGKYERSVYTYRYVEPKRLRTQRQTQNVKRTKTVITVDGVSRLPTYSSVTPLFPYWQNAGPEVVTTIENPPTGEPDRSKFTSSLFRDTLDVATPGRTETPVVKSEGTSVSYSNVGQISWVDGETASTSTTVNGDSNTLADVAEYYYKTDLRTPELRNCESTTSRKDVCTNNVPTSGSTDPAADTMNSQHMNTYTIGMGVSGTLPYDRNYLTQSSGAYVDLKSGDAKWPEPYNPWYAQNTSGHPENVDDLWHAAVNGRGRYFSAQNSTDLSDALNSVVTALKASTGAGSSAGVTSTQILPGTDNEAYIATYKTQEWTGDVQALAVKLDDGKLQIADTVTWSAQAQLDVKRASRTIYFSGGPGELRPFLFNELSSEQKADFANICSKAVQPVQCESLSAADREIANKGDNLLNYLRGDRIHESPSTSGGKTVAPLYRAREHVLGDIVHGGALRVGKPPFRYGDAGYATFATAKASRKPVIYSAANDGMLHAFSADKSDGGQELWAYVPQAVMSELYRLADRSYANNHQYFVDGAPVMGDIKVGSTWKTILVAGLNRGGKAYYALDITDPVNPKALWEFTNSNLGYSYGKPLITKRADGKWVALLTSGYNNTTGDGKGHLFVLDANSGELLQDISTGVGSQTDPSGLAQINAWVESDSDNTAKRVYGGDLKGNLWRFDLDGRTRPYRDALALATFKTASGAPQPITTKPVLVELSGKPVVIVGAGQYLGVNDLSTKDKQSVYGIRDTLTESGWGDVRSDTTNFVEQTITVDAAGESATVTGQEVDWAVKGGWRVDLPHDGERVAIDMVQQKDFLAIVTAIPSGEICTPGGSSWIYAVDPSNGGSNGVLGYARSSSTLLVGATYLDANGQDIVQAIGADGKPMGYQVPRAGGSSGKPHRISWRELVN